MIIITVGDIATAGLVALVIGGYGYLFWLARRKR